MAGLLICLVLVLGAPVLSAVVSVRLMTGGKRMIFRAKDSAAKFLNLPADIKRLLVAHGLTHLDTLQYGSIPFALYGEPPGPPPERHFVVMRTQDKFVSEFVTTFSEDIALTTTRGNHAFALPRRPGAYIQGFTDLNLEQLWVKHLEGELFLLDRMKIKVGPANPGGTDHVARIERVLRLQGECIKSIPLYWLRSIYWFYWLRFRMVNKSLAQQHAAGVINGA